MRKWGRNMGRMIRNAHVLGESMVFRWERSAQQVGRWLVVTTSFEGEGPELAQLIQELLAAVDDDLELTGFEIHTQRHV